MKQNRESSSNTSKAASTPRTMKPQNKDDIDSRSNEEQDTKGDDVTHNKKEVRNNRQRKQDDE